MPRGGTLNWLEEAKQLFHEYAHIFALESLDMGHTSMVDEVKKHLKEMIEVGAVQKSNSPWASAVVLVRKKDGSL